MQNVFQFTSHCIVFLIHLISRPPYFNSRMSLAACNPSLVSANPARAMAEALLGQKTESRRWLLPPPIDFYGQSHTKSSTYKINYCIYRHEHDGRMCFGQCPRDTVPGGRTHSTFSRHCGMLHSNIIMMSSSIVWIALTEIGQTAADAVPSPSYTRPLSYVPHIWIESYVSTKISNFISVDTSPFFKGASVWESRASILPSDDG